MSLALRLLVGRELVLDGLVFGRLVHHLIIIGMGEKVSLLPLLLYMLFVVKCVHF